MVCTIMKIICWDVDEVINSLIKDFLSYMRMHKKDIHVYFDDINHYDLSKVLPLTTKEIGDLIDKSSDEDIEKVLKEI
jgi:5'(3')-deoxyribonucleotidase